MGDNGIHYDFLVCCANRLVDIADRIRKDQFLAKDSTAQIIKLSQQRSLHRVIENPLQRVVVDRHSDITRCIVKEQRFDSFLYLKSAIQEACVLCIT